MKKCFLIFTAQLLCQLALAQVSYTEHIKPIIDTHCKVCHRSGSIGQVALEDYESVVAYAQMIKYVTHTDYMPPWKATGSNLKITPKLTNEEKKLIDQWIQAGFVLGSIDTSVQLENLPDVIDYNIALEVKQPYTHKGDGRPAQRVYVIETDFIKDQYVDAIAFVSGAPSVVSSCTVSIDTSQRSTVLDAKDPKSGYANFASVGFEPLALGWYHWSPDTEPLILENIGKKLPAGAKILLHVSYLPTNESIKDSPKLLLKTREWLDDQELLTHTLINPTAVSKSFVIPKGRTKIIYGKYEALEQIELYGVMPLGQNTCFSWSIYALDTMTLDRLPILEIPEWEFQWRRKYEFLKPIVIPKGHIIISEATYLNNEENENLTIFPTQPVKRGEGKKDEMFGVVFDYVISK